MPALFVAVTLWSSGLSAIPDWFRRHHQPVSGKVHKEHPYAVKRHLYGQDGWQMTIQKDGFTGQVTCQLFKLRTLSQGRITYAQQTLGFEMGKGVDVLKAWYKIDDQPTRPWQSLFHRLAANHIEIDAGPLENPTAGVVYIPVDDLAGARTVTIRARQSSRARAFKLSGFERALATARANGCDPDQSFERYPW